MEYFNIYKKRVNRYGTDYKSRIKNQREQSFENYLLKSSFRIDFLYDGETNPGVFETNKQDETENLHYLLTRLSLKLPNGIILNIPTRDGQEEQWMVWYLEETQSSGYNRYVMLKLNHKLTFLCASGKIESFAYVVGTGAAKASDKIVSKYANYKQDENLAICILPFNSSIKKDDYVELVKGEVRENFRVVGNDAYSLEGVQYLTLNPVTELDTTPPPEKTEEDTNEDFFWFNGGFE